MEYQMQLSKNGVDEFLTLELEAEQLRDKSYNNTFSRKERKQFKKEYSKKFDYAFECAEKFEKLTGIDCLLFKLLAIEFIAKGQVHKFYQILSILGVAVTE